MSRDWPLFFISVVLLLVAISVSWTVYKDDVKHNMGVVMLVVTGISVIVFLCDFFLTEKHYIYTYKVYDWNMVMKGDFIIESQTKDIVKLKMR